ncbi:MAG: hypothetical protein R3313_00900 [Candidatus Saccharimonadales bacterium]|nr:hypothetical protein [Candidatus Saccharimonadales bacterium]
MKKGKIQKSSKEFEFLDGSVRKVTELETAFIGYGKYLPGWNWAEHVGKMTNQPAERHIGYVESGAFEIEDPQGNKMTVGEGEAFEVGPNHNARVMGSEPCIALDFLTK